jgi:hypothetical protein
LREWIRCVRRSAELLLAQIVSACPPPRTCLRTERSPVLLVTGDGSSEGWRQYFSNGSQCWMCPKFLEDSNRWAPAYPDSTWRHSLADRPEEVHGRCSGCSRGRTGSWLSASAKERLRRDPLTLIIGVCGREGAISQMKKCE